MKAFVQFSVANSRSIRERKTLTMVPTSIKDDAAFTMTRCGIKLLPSVAVYGANSSGKSNLLNALSTMKYIIRQSIRLNDGETLPYNPYQFNIESKKSPTWYELTFIINGHQYRYGFENTDKIIVGEWLYEESKKGSIPLFLRTIEGIGVNESVFKEGIGLEEKANENRLFLSLVAQLNGQTSKGIMKFLQNDLQVISGLDSDGYEMFTRVAIRSHEKFVNNMLNFFKKVNLGFVDINVKEQDFDPSQLPDDMPSELRAHIIRDLKGKKKLVAQSIHPIYDNFGEIVRRDSFDMEEVESEGTMKLFNMSGPIFDTLYSGGILVIDELDAKMHPLISQFIVQLFNSKETNPNGAQLIFNTHDTNLLSTKLLRRDQIWFTEKNNKGETDLYRLMDVVMPNQKPPRNDANLERNYIAGRYGAIPFINHESI